MFYLFQRKKKDIEINDSAQIKASRFIEWINKFFFFPDDSRRWAVVNLKFPQTP